VALIPARTPEVRESFSQRSSFTHGALRLVQLCVHGHGSEATAALIARVSKATIRRSCCGLCQGHAKGDVEAAKIMGDVLKGVL
jgi:hypothetical protein